MKLIFFEIKKDEINIFEKELVSMFIKCNTPLKKLNNENMQTFLLKYTK